jgi:Rrf2 family protein
MAYSLSYSKAILVLAFIHDKIRRDETNYISAAIMSNMLDIPKPTLVLIFNSLVKAGILETKEGIHGGVRFARKPEDVSLLDILLAIENRKPLFQTHFDINVQGARPETIKSRIVGHLNDTEEVMKEKLGTIKLADVLQ